ncbi:MAG: hypothetical protein Q9184_007871, partial [Pyrenodesmia sp. 2 TL-2023]
MASSSFYTSSSPSYNDPGYHYPGLGDLSDSNDDQETYVDSDNDEQTYVDSNPDENDNWYGADDSYFGSALDDNDELDSDFDSERENLRELLEEIDAIRREHGRLSDMLDLQRDEIDPMLQQTISDEPDLSLLVRGASHSMEVQSDDFN